MTIRVITDFDELKALSEAWTELLGESHGHGVFLTWEFMSSWVESFLGRHKLLCLVLYDDDKPVAIAPFWVKRMRFGKLFTVRVLKLLVSERVGADHLDIIARNSHRDEAIRVFWDQLYGPLRKEWDMFSLDDIPVSSRTLDRLRRLAEDDYRCVRADFRGYSVCPYLPLPPTFDDFLEGLSRKHRYSISRYKRLLSEHGEVHLDWCKNEADLEEAMSRLIKLNRKSWRERGQEGSFSTPEFIECHRRLASRLLKEGRLMLSTLRVGGRHIGSFYGFIYGTTLYNYITSVERDTDRRVSVGKALIAMCIEEAIRRNCSELDFLRGDEEYKYEWTSLDRRNLSMEFYNRRPKALLYFLYTSTKTCAKQAAKAALGRHADTVNRWRNGAPPIQEDTAD